jgi:hypothetical protein
MSRITSYTQGEWIMGTGTGTDLPASTRTTAWDRNSGDNVNIIKEAGR